MAKSFGGIGLGGGNGPVGVMAAVGVDNQGGMGWGEGNDLSGGNDEGKGESCGVGEGLGEEGVVKLLTDTNRNAASFKPFASPGCLLHNYQQTTNQYFCYSFITKK